MNDKPLIQYTITSALISGIFDNFIVSTDDKKIANVAKDCGAEIPFLRPAELSGDTVWSRDALKHAVLECEKIYNTTYDYVMELPCTAPLRNEVHIKEAYQKLINTGADSVTSVTRMVDKHPVRMKRIVRDRLQDFTTEFPEGEGSRKQDLEACYIRNGAIYSMTRDCIVNDFSRHGRDCRAYVMDEDVSVNIDTLIDFKLAEILIREKYEN